MFDIALLFARKAGVFVVQAAGNNGPAPSSVVSFSPWSLGVGACNTDRNYPSYILLENAQFVDGVGLSGSSASQNNTLYMLCYGKLWINKTDAATIAAVNRNLKPTSYR